MDQDRPPNWRAAKPQATIGAGLIWIALNWTTMFSLGKSPLNTLQVCLAATSISLIGLLASLLSRWSGVWTARFERFFDIGLTVLPLFMLSMAAARDRLPWAVLYTGIVSVLVSVWLARQNFVPSAWRLRSPMDSSPSPDQPLVVARPAIPLSVVTLEMESETGSDVAHGSQWQRRHTEGPLNDCLTGMTCAEFAAGRKQTVVHVAFCPPFSVVPRFTCEASDVAARCRVAAVYPYGARIEVKRTGDCTERARVAIEFTADCGTAVAEIAA